MVAGWVWQCSGGCESRAQFPAPCSCEPPLSELCCRCRCWQPKLPTVAATPEPDLARSGATGEAAQLTVGALAHSSSPPGPPRHHHCPNTRGCCCCCCWKQQSSSRTMLPSDRNDIFIINHSTTYWLFSSLKFFTCPKSVHIPMSGREYLQSQPPPRPPPQSSPSPRGAARLPKTEIALYSQDSNSRNQGCRYTPRKIIIIN